MIVSSVQNSRSPRCQVTSPPNTTNAAHDRPRQVLAGNLNPVKALRDGTPEPILQALADCYRHAGPNYIVAAGCEVCRDTPPANVKALVDFAKSHLPG